MTKYKFKRICIDTFTGKKTAPGVALFLAILLALVCFVPCSAEVTNEDCLACHGDKELEAETERGKTLKLFVAADVLTGSVHEDLSCTDCHQGEYEEVPHGTKEKPLKMDCAGCHDDAYDVFIKGDVHGESYLERNPRAAYCNHCHGGHRILPIASPDSRMAKKHQADTCGNCHGQEKLNLEDNITKRNLIARFKGSVHFRAIREGKNGASCTDCHHHHNILSSAAPTSTVNRTTIMNVCQNCHPNEVRTYNDGPHGRTLKHGNFDVPNCTTCHGDHDSSSPAEYAFHRNKVHAG